MVVKKTIPAVSTEPEPPVELEAPIKVVRAAEPPIEVAAPVQVVQNTEPKSYVQQQQNWYEKKFVVASPEKANNSQ